MKAQYLNPKWKATETNLLESTAQYKLWKMVALRDFSHPQV